MLGIFFLSLLQTAPNRRHLLIKHQRHCPCLLKIGWMRAKWGEQSQESKGGGAHGVDAVHEAGHEWVRRKETIIIPANTSWASACAEAWGRGARDPGSPSHFLWLFLSCSFDLFLRKNAETQGIGSLAVRGAWQQPGDGGQGGAGLGQAGVRAPHPLLHPCCSCPGGRGAGGKGRKQQTARSHPLASRSPLL